MALRPQEVEELGDDLHADHAIYRPLFPRRAQRQWSADDLRGWLLDRRRKSLAPMVWALPGAAGNAMRALPPCGRAGAWCAETLLKRHGREVDQTRGDADGVWPLDGRDCCTPGKESVGGKRPYWGAVGQRAPGPAGVVVGDASHLGSTLWPRRRYRPSAWLEDDDGAERRKKGGGPEDRAVQSPPRGAGRGGGRGAPPRRGGPAGGV
jgi:hypothetical protein